jgi:hypothetical protein
MLEPATVFPEQKLLLLSELVVFAPERVFGQTGAITFVVGKARHVVDAIGQGR